MTIEEVMTALEGFGNDQTKKVWIRHGAREPFYGVKIADLKTLVRKINKDHQLSLELYETGNSDAMYLAGLIADEKEISREQLDAWVKGAYWYMLSEYTVAWIAAESRHGWELALKWIESDKEHIAASGWSTLSSLVSILEDDLLDKERLEELLWRVESDIHRSQNRVRYAMNGFVIAMGSYVPGLKKIAESVAAAIGRVSINMGGTACKVPLATDYIKKVEDRGKTGQKKKIARC